VHARPRVALFSTGDEIVEPDRIPPDGCMRDINKYALSAAVTQAGGAPIRLENVPDDLDAVTATIAQGVREADLVILSGGSSVGAKDFTLSAIDALGEPGVLVHGVAVKPGKPTIFGVAEDTPIIGLPGHPMGALVIFLAFIAPFIRRIGGESDPVPFPSRTTAVLQRSVPGSPGRRTYIPITLSEGDTTDVPVAVPILGKSGIITTMMESHGLLAIPENREGYAKGDHVTIFRYADIVG
jgi:molybdopterin molybdotransferase